MKPNDTGWPGQGLPLVNRLELSPTTINRMVSSFACHEVDKQGFSSDAYGMGQASNGLISSRAPLSCSTCGAPAPSVPPWVEEGDSALMALTSFNLQNLRGQSLLFRCLDTGFVTTAPALTRYQQGRGIDTSRRELVGERPAQWCRSRPVTICEHCGLAIKGNQWTLRQHQQSKRCRRTRTPLPL